MRAAPSLASPQRKTPRQAQAPWLFWPFLLLILIAPAALGANRPAAWSALALGLGLLTGLWAFAARRSERLMPVPAHRLAPAGFALAGAILWSVLLASPWTPGALHDPAWAAAGAALGKPLPGAIGITPAEAGTGVMRLLSYGAVLWLAVQLGYGRRAERRILWGVALAGGAYALYGIAVWLTGNDLLLWLPKWSYADSLTSTFVSRNSYATYAGLGLMAALTLLARALSRKQAVAARMAPLLFVGAVILAALMLTRSRGGTAAVLIAALCLPFLGAGMVSLAGRRIFLGGICALLILTVLLLGSGIVGRLGPEAIGSWGGRAEIWSGAAKAAAAHPLGSGLGSFADRYSAYRAPSAEEGRTARAHNLYLGLVVELGPAAALALIVSIGWLAARVAIAARRERPGATLAATAASLMVALHSMVDFSLEIPAVTATYLLLLGAGIAAAERARRAAQRVDSAKTRA